MHCPPELRLQIVLEEHSGGGGAPHPIRITTSPEIRTVRRRTLSSMRSVSGPPVECCVLTRVRSLVA